MLGVDSEVGGGEGVTRFRDGERGKVDRVKV